MIHGAGKPRRRQGRVYWEPLLGDTLGRGYRVLAPRMPRPEHPQYWTWARRIDELIRRTRRPVLVGHSFGASVLLKYLAETVRRPTPAGLFLVAMPFWGPDFPEFALPPDFGARLRDLSPDLSIPQPGRRRRSGQASGALSASPPARHGARSGWSGPRVQSGPVPGTCGRYSRPGAPTRRLTRACGR